MRLWPIAIAVFAGIACSSPEIGDPPLLEKPVVKKSKDAGDPDPVPSTTTTSKNVCATEVQSVSCWGCCQDQFPFTADILTPVTDCDCQKCATACADTFCNQLHIAPTDGDACDLCMKSNAKACDAKADIACAADPACAKFASCGKTAGCEAKP